MSSRALLVHLVLVGVLGVATMSHASSPEICAPTSSIDRYRLLRQLSIDLRGDIPSITEYEALHQVNEVPEQWIEEVLESEAFYENMRDYHRLLVWPTLVSMTHLLPGWVIIPPHYAGQPNPAWYNFDRVVTLRGRSTACLDMPHTQFDDAGRPIPMIDNSPGCPATGCKMDGWVMVAPYWAPDTQIKVCAFDAQALSQGATGACEGPYAHGDPGCGCGPGLQWCVAGIIGSVDGTDHLIRTALIEEPLRIFETVIREDLPYFDALTTKATYLNGPLAHFYKHMALRLNLSHARVSDPRMGALPDIPFTEMRSVRHERESMHSGALTTFAFLRRFSSNRARADRFYTSFACMPFIGPTEGLPSATDSCSAEPDLSERCGCSTCHARLEPSAAHWGRWDVFGATELFGYLDPVTFTNQRADCAACTGKDNDPLGRPRCSPDCATYYVTPDTVNTAKEQQWVGTWRPLQWRSPEEVAAIDAGPSTLVEKYLQTGDLARCTVRTLTENMLHRKLSDAEMLEWVPELVSDFASSGYNFKELLRTVVHSELYRSIQ